MFLEHFLDEVLRNCRWASNVTPFSGEIQHQRFTFKGLSELLPYGNPEVTFSGIEAEDSVRMRRNTGAMGFLIE